MSNTTKNNPVYKTAKWAITLMKSKIIVSLIMLVTGFLFLLTPSGNMNGMVIIISIVVILASLINICMHLIPKNRSGIDFFLSFINLLLIAFAVFCIVSPSTVEPIVRYIFAVLTIISNLVNIIEVLKLENKKSFQFFIGLFVGIIMVGLGIAMIVAGETVISSIQRGVGIFLIINSLINIWYIIRLAIKAKKASKQ